MTSIALNAFRFIDNTILRPHQRIIRQIVMSYIVVPVGTLRSIQEQAMQQVWRWLLLGRRCGDPMIVDSVSGILREAASEDENEDGVIDPQLNFVNVLWKLQLSWDSNDVQLIRRVILMVGPPPHWGQRIA